MSVPVLSYRVHQTESIKLNPAHTERHSQTLPGSIKSLCSLFCLFCACLKIRMPKALSVSRVSFQTNGTWALSNYPPAKASVKNTKLLERTSQSLHSGDPHVSFNSFFQPETLTMIFLPSLLSGRQVRTPFFYFYSLVVIYSVSFHKLSPN